MASTPGTTENAGRQELLRVYNASFRGVDRLEMETFNPLFLQPAQRGVVDALGRLLAQLNDDPSRAIVALRLLDEIPTLVAQLGAEGLRDAGSARDGRAALVAALLSPPAVLDERVDSLDAAALAGAELGREMLEMEGGTWGMQQVAAHLALTRQAVDQRVRRHRLLAVAPGGFRQRFPAWQFDDTGVLPGFEEIAVALAEDGVDAWGRLLFFLSQQDDLAGPRPLDALRLGDREGVRRAARRFGGGRAE